MGYGYGFGFGYRRIFHGFFAGQSGGMSHGLSAGHSTGQQTRSGNNLPLRIVCYYFSCRRSRREIMRSRASAAEPDSPSSLILWSIRERAASAPDCRPVRCWYASSGVVYLVVSALVSLRFIGFTSPRNSVQNCRKAPGNGAYGVSCVPVLLELQNASSGLSGLF